MTRRTAFTIVELLVVVSIMTLLIALLLPAMGKAREHGRSAVCMSGLRQMMEAWHSYTDDNEGRMMGAHTASANFDWVVTPNAPPYQEVPQNLYDGRLWLYMSNLDLYKCPSDPRQSYLRTYSMSNYFAGAGWSITPAMRVDNVAGPSSRMVLVEEPDPRGYNWGSWVINPKGSAAQWIDWVASYHLGACNLSFGDSHVEHWQWEDQRTIDIQWFSAVTPGNPDFVRVQNAYTP